MPRPLYASVARDRVELSPHGHAGLWFDKFCNKWEEKSWKLSSTGGANNPKLEWIETVADGKKTVGDRPQLEEFAKRVRKLVHGSGGRDGEFKAEWRFVTGLGRSHPVENGFAWHPSLGTPYLPGSSIKGMVRAWATAEAEADKSQIARILGDENKQEAGRVCFLDAVPKSPVRLEPDVMTPHYAGWDEENPPGDWRSPVPIPFLTMAPGTVFWFGLVPCGELQDGDLETAWRWMVDALQSAGAGAKTAVGYGRFLRDEAAEKKRQKEHRDAEAEQKRKEKEEKEKREAEKTPEGRWRWKLKSMKEPEVLDAVRKNLEKGDLSDPAERVAFARAVLNTGYFAAWKKGKTGTTTGKKKLKKRVRLLEEIAEHQPPRTS